MALFLQAKKIQTAPHLAMCVRGSRAQYVAQFSSMLSEQYPYQQSISP